MNRLRIPSFVLSLFAVGTCGLVGGQEKRPLTPPDCTSIRYLETGGLSRESSLQESPDRTRIAYVVEVPNIATNNTQSILYVADVKVEQYRPPTLVLTAKRVSELQWLPDNRHIAALFQDHGRTILAQIDVTTGKVVNIGNFTEDVDDYSMDADGDAFAISVRGTSVHGTKELPPGAIEKGYRISPESRGYADPLRTRDIYVIRRSSMGVWVHSGALSFVSPLSGKLISTFTVGHGMDLSLSPDGSQLLVDNIEEAEDIPPSWRANPYVMWLMQHAGIVIVSYMYDLETKRVSVPLRSPLVREHTIWSPDSRSFARVALPPLNSDWERQDLQGGVPSDRNTHLFTVDIGTGKIQEAMRRTERPPVLWTSNGNLLIRREDGVVRWLRNGPSGWEVSTELRIPLPNVSLHNQLVTDGNRFFGDYQDASTAPELFEYSPSTKKITVLAKLNPQVDEFLLPQVKRIQWKTSTGFQANGLLLLPPDYNPSLKYPLVIENGSLLYNGDFVCDSGMSHVSSFVRGMLAEGGILYLIRSWPGNDNWERNFYPKGYPGGIAEAAFKMDLVESAIDYLDREGMIEPGKIGLIGFSRGGWYTEYALTHSHIRFRAATVTDNVEYASGSYWYLHSFLPEYDAMYGGPPYGKTLQSWKDYSISFNTEKVHTPLMIEVMGYGLRDDDPRRPPNNLSLHFELTTALERQGKPVEMYYYPNEQHQVEHPVARVSSLQRNIDWFRFWLQGYERLNPEDHDQYKRWEVMRAHADSIQ